MVGVGMKPPTLYRPVHRGYFCDKGIFVRETEHKPICPMVRGVVDSQRLLAFRRRSVRCAVACPARRSRGYGAYKPCTCRCTKRYPALRLLCPALPPVLLTAPTNAALMGHPIHYATEPHAVPKSSTSTYASGWQRVLAAYASPQYRRDKSR